MHDASHLTSSGLRYANINQLAETQSVRSRACRCGRFSCVKCLASGDAKRCHGNRAQLTQACSDGPGSRRYGRSPGTRCLPLRTRSAFRDVRRRWMLELLVTKMKLTCSSRQWRCCFCCVTDGETLFTLPPEYLYLGTAKWFGILVPIWHPLCRVRAPPTLIDGVSLNGGGRAPA